MILRTLILTAVFCGLSGAIARAGVTLPSGATLRYEKLDDAAAYALPVGGHDGDKIPTIRTEGMVLKQAWRIGGTGRTSFQIVGDLRQQLLDQGYDILFECDQASCGGFDFRFDTVVIGEPEMHVDLGNYQFLSAHVPGDSNAFLSLLVSRSGSAAFVQVIEVGPAIEAPSDTVASTKADPVTSVPLAQGTIGAAMEEVGRFILTDLTFETGSTSLGQGSYDSLAELADYLTARPTRRVALVGHTDAVGSLAANITVSEARAASVMDRLISEYGVPASQLEARGIGYLAPIASNQTDTGRTQNRRVEAILVSTE